MKSVLAIDQGTTGTTALVFNDDGKLRGRAYREIRQFYPASGWVEHDPEELYRSVIETGGEALRLGRCEGSVAAIGITNQRETFVIWERASGRPIGRAIVWQCRRSAEICNAMRSREPDIARRTGLVLDPYFSATKLKWWLDRNPAARRRAIRGELCFGTVDSWIVFRLTRGSEFITDVTNASRTMLLNLDRRTWDPAMLRMMDVPPAMLPRVVSSRGPVAEAAPGTIAARPIPIGAIIGDQQAALFGQGAVRAGAAKVTYGTGAFLLAHTGSQLVHSRRRLLSTIALDAEGTPAYALEGSVFVAGAAIQWLRDGLKIIETAAESEALARRGATRGSLYMIPAFVGLGAPYWDSAARGALLGLTRDTNRADIAAAALDAIAYQITDVISAMEDDMGRRLTDLRVDGGASVNDYLMQTQADLSGRTIRRPVFAEATAQGAAMLAGLALGVWKSPEVLDSMRKIGRIFRPSISSVARKRLVDGWREAVARILTVKPATRRIRSRRV